MKYTLTTSEEEGINAGNILTIACYRPKDCVLAELIGNQNKIKFKYGQSESPTGKDIYIFFFYPETYYQAFRIGGMAERPDLYSDESNPRIPFWEHQFELLAAAAKHKSIAAL